MNDLAVVVPKPETGETIEALREEGVYDDTRRVREHDGGRIEVPVIAVPESVAGEVVEQDAPELRVAGLDDLLRERGFSEAEIAGAPSSWATIGDVVLVRFGDYPHREAVAEALLDLQDAGTVLDRGGIDGEHREPDVEVVAGSGETETVHTEHGCRYRVDPTETYFSERLGHERERVIGKIQPDEQVHIWFAGVGPYAILAATETEAKHIHAIEKNPAGCRFLEDNVELNKVDGIVRPFCGDVRGIVPELPRPDRIVMPLPKSADQFLELALERIAPGGVIHYYRFSEDETRWEQPEQEVAAGAEVIGRSYSIEERTVCGHYAPYIHRVCLDVRVS